MVVYDALTARLVSVAVIGQLGDQLFAEELLRVGADPRKDDLGQRARLGPGSLGLLEDSAAQPRTVVEGTGGRAADAKKDEERMHPGRLAGNDLGSGLLPYLPSCPVATFVI